MIRGEATVVNRLGLHARAAARFVQLASRYRSTVRVEAGGRAMDGKSILGLLLLAASQGTRVVIEVDGVDEQDALTALVGLVERGFEEEA
ncbi:MAG: HPr family phosphocarrier protein [Acidobacteriota bacterium]|jgi:phosphocarrier protein HPr|nr:MAG: HPr family phosphocarrier protein [Acidobacteriota bacterium]